MNTPESESLSPEEVMSPASIVEEETQRSSKKKEALELPLPPGALPPRKRAKTNAEKEQRRVERIMRNRQAAHASREKKRKHVENLERENEELKKENGALLSQAQETKKAQIQMLEQHYLLQARLSQFEAVIEAAKSSGDLSALEKMPKMPMTKTEVVVPTPPMMSPPGSTSSTPPSVTSPILHVSDHGYASPDSLTLSPESTMTAFGDDQPHFVLSSTPTSTTITATKGGMEPLASVIGSHHSAVMMGLQTCSVH
ncbi:hypothetical protein TRVA0_022S02212 [Trichomonascus vanleenenianus]|uniref:transcription factor HAC1 n=1 Tax=Trichomonascus vanleenenianus TaxID=2268995 RepID=UPI003ECB4093